MGTIYPQDREVRDSGEEGHLRTTLILENALEPILRRHQSLATPLAVGGPRKCADCGEEIDPERLKAVPGTDKCVVCKGKEKLSRHTVATVQGIIHRQRG